MRGRPDAWVGPVLRQEVLRLRVVRGQHKVRRRCLHLVEVGERVVALVFVLFSGEIFQGAALGLGEHEGAEEAGQVDDGEQEEGVLEADAVGVA